MFNKRNPSQEELAAQREALVKQLAAIGLKPEDVPQAMEELRRQLNAELAEIQKKFKKAVS